MSGLISCVSWVKRGVAAQHPQKYNLDERELERVSKLARIEIEDARQELERAHEAAKLMGRGAEGAEADDRGGEDEDEWVDEDEQMDVEDLETKNKNDEDDLAKYNLDEYDKESKSIAAGPFSNIKGLVYYKDNDEDPYITLNEDDEEIEREELEVLPTDNLLVAAKTEDEISQLEVYVYDETQENLYVHHDIMLPAFPLCLEWLDFPPAGRPSSTTSASIPNNNNISNKASEMAIDLDNNPSPSKQFGNYIAVGTFDPEIEIWSLDTVDALYPDSMLGRPDITSAHVPTPLGTGKKKRKKQKHRPTSTAHHVDAVLSLAWNRAHRNLLASASADRTVKLWDLSREPSATGDGGGAIRSFDVHKDKVQTVQWNEKEPTVLLTGSYDRTVRTFDTRAPTAGVGAVVGADVEAVRWDPWESTAFYVSLENGIVLNFDARVLPSDLTQPSPSRFMLAAHNGAASALDVNPHIRGCIVTGGTDKMVKVWNINDKDNGKKDVSLVTSHDLGVGKVFSATFSPDDPLTIAAAGSKAKLQIWDVGANVGARKAFAQKLKEAGREVRQKEGGGVVGVVSDDEEVSGDEDE
ncbi:transducin family protein/WD-40 repeat family protein [Fomitiporia mediterranea MF3/22]|uniref:transducin family protein/WD-40 repeat family protein n=1 Tax=Fomitiporia mediterranea (strain MF3/22) TaxID=694068 RepID=UPI00044082CD|nr:transducin family protein/WD-40 repeat family protein [Fomitiporia mediterranea MF3/22]EJD06886.1 transducin family protein/WD-40 repeat family protein [Fomitiporia mediterranea MF3/22]